MRYILIFLFCVGCSAVFGQNNIKKTAAVQYTQGVPTWTPAVASSSEISIDTSTGKIYQWHRTTSAWLQLGQGIDVISGSIAPAYTPARNMSIFAINAVDSLYIYRSGAWRHLNAGGGDDWGAQVVEVDATLTGDGTSGDPLAWAGASVAGPLTGSGTSGFPLNILSASLDSTHVKNYGLSVLDLGQHSASTGQVLKWNGTQWAPAADTDTDTGVDVGIINALDYGVVGDGVTDDRDSMQAAIDAAVGRRLWIPDGTYVVSDSLVVSSNTEIVMSPNAVIDASGWAPATAGDPYGHFVFSIVGTKSDSTVITQDIAVNDYDIKVTSGASAFAKNDLVEVKSNQPLHTAMTNRYKGFVSVVDSIIGDTIIRVSTKSAFIIDAVGGSYAAWIVKWNAKEKIKIIGGKILGAGVGYGMIGVMGKFTRDVVIENVIIEDCEMSAIGFEESFTPVVKNCRLLRATSSTYLGLNLGYGVWLGTATYGGLVEGCYFEECRHSVAAGGETPSVNGMIINNNAINAGLATEDFDCHEATYGYRFIGNTTHGGPDSRGGFNLRGVDVYAAGNIVNNGYIRLANNYSADNEMGRMTLVGNVVKNTTTGIDIISSGMYDISIIGGSIENVSTVGIGVSNTSRNIRITGVTIINSSGPAISLDNCDGATISDCTFQGCTIGVRILSTSENISVSNCVGTCTNSFLTAQSANNIVVSNCIVSGITASHGIYFNLSNNCRVSNCLIDMSAASSDAIRAWGSSSTAHNISAIGNKATGTYSRGLYCFGNSSANSDTITAIGNDFRQATTAAVYAPNATMYYFFGNASHTVDHGDITESGTGPGLNIDANVIDSTNVCTGCISITDLGQHGASTGHALKWNGTQWAGGTVVTSVAATAPAAGFTVSGSPITTTGTLTFALANDLSGVEGLSGTGIATRTATDTWTTRTITAGTGVSMSNGNGVSGNPTISVDTSLLATLNDINVTAGQVAYGSGTNTIAGSNNMWYNGPTLTLNSSSADTLLVLTRDNTSPFGIYQFTDPYNGSTVAYRMGGLNGRRVFLAGYGLYPEAPFYQQETAGIGFSGTTGTLRLHTNGDYYTATLTGENAQTNRNVTYYFESGGATTGYGNPVVFQNTFANNDSTANGFEFISRNTASGGKTIADSSLFRITSWDKGVHFNLTQGGKLGLGTRTPADVLSVVGNVNLTTAGNKLKIATGSNASMGTATLVAGTVTVSTTAVATGSTIFLTCNTPGGVQGFLSAPVASITNATSFVINSSNVADTSTVNWWIVN